MALAASFWIAIQAYNSSVVNSVSIPASFKAAANPSAPLLKSTSETAYSNLLKSLIFP